MRFLPIVKLSLLSATGLLCGGSPQPDQGESLEQFSGQPGLLPFYSAPSQRLLNDITGELLQTKSFRLRTSIPAKRINVQRARLTFLGEGRQNPQRSFHNL
jgi:hypothetical protein